jgi:hypothetical protein
VIFPSNLRNTAIKSKFSYHASCVGQKREYAGEKSTCLSQHKATLMLFRSCSLETLDPRDFETSARPSTRRKHRAEHVEQTNKNN